MRNLPLAMADAVEWGTRKLDIFVLRFFVGEGALGVYYFAQQVATLPQKLKTSFEPILGPVITRNLREGNLDAIARQVRQVRSPQVGAEELDALGCLGDERVQVLFLHAQQGKPPVKGPCTAR